LLRRRAATQISGIGGCAARIGPSRFTTGRSEIRQLLNPHRGFSEPAMPIRDLTTHPVPYVSVGELATYWIVSRKQIYKQIDAGTLQAIRLGPRLFRIRTDDARKFEEQARMYPVGVGAAMTGA
jgi:excisionase family DNA binding protein